jgi:hypothetical protein
VVATIVTPLLEVVSVVVTAVLLMYNWAEARVRPVPLPFAILTEGGTPQNGPVWSLGRPSMIAGSGLAEKTNGGELLTVRYALTGLVESLINCLAPVARLIVIHSQFAPPPPSS